MRFDLLPATIPFSQKTRTGRCPDPEIITARILERVSGALWLEDIPGIFNMNICADREPSPAVPSTLMPLPSRSSSAGLPVVLDTARLSRSPMLPATTHSRALYQTPVAA